MKSAFEPFPRRAFLSVLLTGSVLMFSLQPGEAIIDVNLQMQLGNPTEATSDATNHAIHHLHYLIRHPQYALDYSDTNCGPNWVSWDLTASDVGSSGRTDAWSVETNVPPDFHPVPTSTFGSVNGQTYDRGHMCPSADRTVTTNDNKMVFIMSNIIPQASQNNQGLWEALESYSRSLAATQELLIISGPSSFGTNRITASTGRPLIASNVWKIVVCVPLGAGTALSRITSSDPNSVRVIAILTPNNSSVSGHAWTEYRTSVKQLEQETGYRFFSALPNNLAWTLRGKVDGQPAAAPSALSFSPASGPVATSVAITGANLDSITNVTFNGASAPYNIDSPTQITAVVPAGTSSGPIGVQGLGGNSVSASNFAVTSGAVSPFPITTTGFVGPNRFVITWASVSGHTYQVRSATSLAVTNWTTNATLTATAAFTSWTNLAAFGAVGFYRVVDTP